MRSGFELFAGVFAEPIFADFFDGFGAVFDVEDADLSAEFF